jgi:hypothetical protein
MARASEGHACGCAAAPESEVIAIVIAATCVRARAGTQGTAIRFRDRASPCVVVAYRVKSVDDQLRFFTVPNTVGMLG